MKKIAGLVAAGALLLASTGMVAAKGHHEPKAPEVKVINNQDAHQLTLSGAISNSGLNYSGGLMSNQYTGTALALSESASDSNGATIKITGCGNCRSDILVVNNQDAHQLTGSAAVSNSGLNYSGGFGSTQSTGVAQSQSGAYSWANYSTIVIQ